MKLKESNELNEQMTIEEMELIETILSRHCRVFQWNLILRLRLAIDEKRHITKLIQV
jgi:hypothetical protein